MAKAIDRNKPISFTGCLRVWQAIQRLRLTNKANRQKTLPWELASSLKLKSISSRFLRRVATTE